MQNLPKGFSCESFYRHVAWHEKDNYSAENMDQPLISNFSMKNNERERFEFEIIKFVVGNNLSFSLIETLMSLFKTFQEEDFSRQVNFPKLDRKRGSIIANIYMSDFIKRIIEMKMDTGFYHLIIDEVSDRFGKGYLGISVRFLDENLKPSTKFYRLIKFEDDSSGEALFSILMSTILFTEKRRKNLVSLVTDGTGNMTGEEKGVASRIAEIVPDLFWFHCICHCINLTIRTTCTNATEDMTRFVQEISNTFAFSNIEHAKLQVIQTEMELEENKILRFAPTRWLSLGKCSVE